MNHNQTMLVSTVRDKNALVGASELPVARVTPEPAADELRGREPDGARCLWRARQRLKKILRIPLGIHYQYEPRPLCLPTHYYKTSATQAPLVFSIVTPSYHQGHFLETTMKSILDQNYPQLQYIIQDGGSTDETCAILARYQSQLTHWSSCRDRGQAHAINLGFQHATGDILAYLNSDDLLLPGTLHYVADFFARHSEIDVVYGHRVLIDSAGAEVGRWILPRHDDDFLRWADFVPQETLFWRRRIWDKVGAALDESFHYALDWDLLLRFRAAGARFARLPRFLGAFRLHPEQKTSLQMYRLGVPEMDRLCLRTHRRHVPHRERYRNLIPYLCKHLFCHALYKLGALRY